MYYTKRFNGKNSKDYLAIGDPYGKKAPVKSSYKNAQFQTNPPRKGQTAGYFSTSNYSTSPYLDTKAYINQQPKDQRRQGFGSHDARRRDEFTLDIRARQWKEKLKTENQFAKANILATKRGSPGDEPKTSEAQEALRQQRYKEKYADTPDLFQTRVPFSLYDIGRDSYTRFNNKSSRDTFYDINVVAQQGLRRPGTCPTSYETYGNFDHYPTTKPQYGSVTETKSFYDHGHLSIGRLG
jgi:hypothetical protein